MARKPSEQETPQGHRIPVPKRGDVFRDFRKVAGKAKPNESDDSDGPEGGAEDQQGE